MAEQKFGANATHAAVSIEHPNSAASVGIVSVMTPPFNAPRKLPRRHIIHRAGTHPRSPIAASACLQRAIHNHARCQRAHCTIRYYSCTRALSVVQMVGLAARRCLPAAVLHCTIRTCYRRIHVRTSAANVQPCPDQRSRSRDCERSGGALARRARRRRCTRVREYQHSNEPVTPWCTHVLHCDCCFVP